MQNESVKWEIFAFHFTFNIAVSMNEYFIRKHCLNCLRITIVGLKQFDALIRPNSIVLSTKPFRCLEIGM